MKYTSIRNTLRGHNIQEDYNSIKDFKCSMKRNQEANDDSNWALLIDAATGGVIFTYNKGNQIFLNNV